MRIGLFQNIQWPEDTQQLTQFTNAIDQVRHAEQLGFESAFFVEHHWTRHGILSSTLTTLSYVAGLTSTMRLGTAVLVLPFHDPVRLAEEAATVDLLSGGRLDLGVGRGFQWTEFNGFDIPLDESTARYDEALDIILKSWRTPGTFSYQGRFHSYNDISVEPKPLQAPHPPVWCAAGNLDSATKAGRLGLNMQLSSGLTLERMPAMLNAYKTALAENGHTFKPDMVLVSRMAHLEATRERAWEVALPHYTWFRNMLGQVTPAPANVQQNSNPLPENMRRRKEVDPDDPALLFCSPDECCEALQQIQSLGVGQVIFQSNWGGISQEDALRSINLIGREVLPHFASGD
jgi:alkanesulfonate monooxygenase SsuD/methylene tetrahydromethanopterin reductase-like flavin-dependent oxidoreductase (luciferase family)